jgi:hypothetical protein
MGGAVKMMESRAAVDCRPSGVDEEEAIDLVRAAERRSAVFF